MLAPRSLPPLKLHRHIRQTILSFSPCFRSDRLRQLILSEVALIDEDLLQLLAGQAFSVWRATARPIS